ncbi:bifunctional helix-turn-helix transcriptional regulator/GNAT family N-acetyltransferase [Nocardioides sp. zg-ZUI104]|uniref:bifunctional helix-turn-helix transcriptional regulator/GNAT family N-acetyltransferase n=1 Tax=Nocardioides faecalis TaxID=2803858 RepID=UPI001BCB982C|nr:bifunctional helix-turn-helix transcriptional regulator/GNAT family N-acetyltransferase [Nocardioides faecalis]MBS4752710.1 bifunctional helix-turn-helix transcriptional regulator/GNAT family N-acetyltransferase [Nocardioides faecalis]
MSAVQALRSFNRTYTRHIGALDDSFLGTGRPLAASRLLFEIGSAAPDGITVRELRTRLGLDSGQLSRMLRQLEADDLVTTAPDPADRRRRRVSLTQAGAAAYDDLERRAQRQAEGLLAPLTTRQQQRLGEALATADLLVRAARVRLQEVSPAHPSAAEAVRHYVTELDTRFPGGFATGGPDPAEPGATYVVATADGAPVAYGGIRPVPEVGPGAAEVKRMWVHGEWRGAGLGARMLRHLEDLAAQQGFGRVVLDTHATLTEAIALYERSGYRQVERYNDNPYAQVFFSKDL